MLLQFVVFKHGKKSSRNREVKRFELTHDLVYLSSQNQDQMEVLVGFLADFSHISTMRIFPVLITLSTLKISFRS